jgi:hypothetical protein
MNTQNSQSSASSEAAPARTRRDRPSRLSRRERSRPDQPRSTRARTRTIALITAASLAAAALVTGGGLALQASASAQDRIASTSALSESTGRQHDQLAAYDAIAAVHAKDAASVALAEANQVITTTQNRVDATPLTDAVSSLAGYDVLPIDQVESLTAHTKAVTASVAAAAAEAERVAAEAAAAAAAAAEAQRVAELAAANTPDGARAVARNLAASKYGWGADQFSCLNLLWQKESKWSYSAINSSSGATGIPQALPGSKMASAGSDWASNAATQIAWGLGYISSVYGTPCAAWSHSQAVNSY